MKAQEYLERVQVNERMRRDIVEMVLPQEDIADLMEIMEDKHSDEQSSDLARKVWKDLAKALELTEDQMEAFNRLKGSIANKNKWSAGMLRNNLFKAANVLNIKLPSMSF